jgi:hypothetical protein
VGRRRAGCPRSGGFWRPSPSSPWWAPWAPESSPTRWRTRCGRGSRTSPASSGWPRTSPRRAWRHAWRRPTTSSRWTLSAASPCCPVSTARTAPRELLRAMAAPLPTPGSSARPDAPTPGYAGRRLAAHPLGRRRRLVQPRAYPGWRLAHDRLRRRARAHRDRRRRERRACSDRHRRAARRGGVRRRRRTHAELGGAIRDGRPPCSARRLTLIGPRPGRGCRMGGRRRRLALARLVPGVSRSRGLRGEGGASCQGRRRRARVPMGPQRSTTDAWSSWSRTATTAAGQGS